MHFSELNLSLKQRKTKDCKVSNRTFVHCFSHISSSTYQIRVIQVGLETRLEELSNDRLHAFIRFLDRKLQPSEVGPGKLPRARATVPAGAGLLQLQNCRIWAVSTRGCPEGAGLGPASAGLGRGRGYRGVRSPPRARPISPRARVSGSFTILSFFSPFVYIVFGFLYSSFM